MSPILRLLRRGALGVLLLLPGYAGLSYVLVPAAWSRYERRRPSLDALRVTYTREQIPADPLNVGLVGTRAQVIAAMRAAGWELADPISVQSGLRDASSVIFDRPYAAAPVSTHYLWGRPQDLAFEQVVGRSPRRRHHVRLWRAGEAEPGAPPIWVGSATYDRSLGVSRFTGEFMHHIDRRVDDEREKLFDDLKRSGRLARVWRSERFRPAGNGVNGGGDPYESDGGLLVGVLRPDDGELAEDRRAETPQRSRVKRTTSLDVS